MPSKILIVEDDRATRRAAGAAPPGRLRHDCGVRLPRGPASAQHEAPDLLIADLRLEGFNGLQLLHINPRPIPTIIVTGFPDEVLKAGAQLLGAEYLVKPVPPPALLAAIERVSPAPIVRSAGNGRASA